MHLIDAHSALGLLERESPGIVRRRNFRLDNPFTFLD